MAFDDDRLRDIFTRTDGRCHICYGTLAFSNYGQHGQRGAWEVDHSVPRALGGTNRLTNLYAACTGCNRAKGARSTRSVRGANGYSRAPLSTQARHERRINRTIGGAALGGMMGGRLGGRQGLVLGGLIGALIAHAIEDDA